MKTETIIKELKHYQNPQGIRAYCQLWYLDSISKARGGCYEAVLSAAGEKLLQKAKENGAVTADMLKEMEASLSELGGVAKEYTLHMVSHAHIDMNWMWGYHETVATTLETFRTVLRMMEEYPGFTYAQSQASVYQIVEKYEPEMLTEIRRRIKEKRWEVTASTWVEGDKNMASGEAQCRQILQTKQYLSWLLDIDPDELRVDFEPDTFGHTVYEPEILKSAGVDWLYHCRGCDQRDIYRWRAPSGKEILVFQEPKWYNATLSPIFLADYPTYCAGVASGKLRDILVVYGVGDHGGGPTRRDIETIIDLQSWPLFPAIKFGRYEEYFRKIEQLREDLPVYEGESNFIFDGCYTSQSRLKMANSLSEKRLYDADVLTALSGLTDNHGMLTEAWQHTLFNQFHDILPGSCVIDSREWSMGKFQEVLAAANTASNKALRKLTERIDTTGIDFDDNRLTNSEGAGIGYNMGNEALYPFSFTERGKGNTRVWHIFNTTQYDREEFTEVTVWDYPGDLKNVRLTDDLGNELPFMVTVENRNYMGMHRVSKILVKVKEKAFGYTTCILRQNPEAAPVTKLVSNCNGPRREHDLGDRNYILENENIYCEFDAVTCALVSLKDKKTGQEMMGTAKAACYEYVEENPRFSMTSWRVGPAMKKVNLNESCAVRVKRYERSEVLSALEYTIQFQSSTITTLIQLVGERKYLDFYVTVDWVESSRDNTIPALRFLLNPGYTSKQFRYAVGSGNLVRGELPHDVPSLGTMEFLPEEKQDSYLMLFSDYKYGFRGTEGDCGVHLIRSSDSPDPLPELGRHHMHIYVGAASDAQSAARMAKCAVHAMPAVSGYAHKGELPLTGSLLDYQGQCVVTAVKNGVQGGKVIRLFNPKDTEQTVTVGVCGQAFVTDTAELTAEILPVSAGKAEVTVPAHSYKTILLK